MVMKKMPYKKITLLVSIFFLFSCKSALIQTGDSYLEIPKTATIEITQSIEVAPNSARAFLQDGGVIPYARLNLYNVNCEIEINTVSEARQTIEAGVFDVIATSVDESPIVKNLWMKKPVQVASLNYAWGSDSPVDIKRYYHFKLSAQNPDSNSEVRAVICRGVQDTPYNAKLPTFQEIRIASGPYLKFNF